MSSTIAVEDLRIGIYVQLEGGWLSHPFPLSGFRIASDEQLVTLRGLGLKQVRWVPEKSDPPESVASVLHAAAPRPALSPAETAAAQRRQALADQREAQQRCERQYGEAARAWREASDTVSLRPEDARRLTEALTAAMLDKLLVDSDIGIRLVNVAGADRSAAHALNVAVISLLIGRTLGLQGDELHDLGVGALLHDVGKIDLAERLRHADDGLNWVDMAAYREHVVRGVAHGKRMALAPGALSVLAQHHEHADGSGFPQQLSVDRMSLASRIVAIVNRYDNLCNPPARNPALTPHEAVATLFAQGRTRFDAAVLGTFIRMTGVYPAGSLVQLTDDRYAMVVGINSSRPLKPRVLVHDPRVPKSEALVLNLEHARDIGIRRSLAPAKMPSAALDYLDPRPRVAYYFEALATHVQAEEVAA